MVTIVLLFLGVILGSALCSVAEAAFLSLPVLRARILLEQNKKNAHHLLYVKNNITNTIITIVFVNTVINVVGSIFIGQQITLKFGNQWLGILSAVLTFCIIVFSEIIPKTVGERYKVPLSLVLAKPFRWLVMILRPIVFLLMLTTKPFVKESKGPKVTEDEIRMMLKLGRDEGTVEMDEEVLCNRVFKLNDVRAVQIMRPIEQIYALQADKTLQEVKDSIINSKFSRIAIYANDPKDVVGMVQQRVLLREIAKDNYNAKVRDFMVEPIFVNWFTKADALLEKFQETHQHLFVVQDSMKKDVGLVTMEDVLEELFGEIYDETDIVKFKGENNSG